jgi:hypothetical protein
MTIDYHIKGLPVAMSYMQPTHALTRQLATLYAPALLLIMSLHYRTEAAAEEEGQKQHGAAWSWVISSTDRHI